MDIGTKIQLFSVGGAAIALWLIARYPNRAPKSVTVSLLLIVAAYIVLSVVAEIVGRVSASAGPAATLMVVVLPAYVGMFWACACFIKACVQTMQLGGR
jgi:hypothetical protein